MTEGFDLNTLTQLFIRYFDREDAPDGYLISLCTEPSTESPERKCVSANYSRNGRHFALDGIRQPGYTQFLHPLTLWPDKKNQSLHPVVAPEFSEIERKILRPALHRAEDQLTTLSAINLLDPSVTIAPHTATSGTRDVDIQFSFDGQTMSFRIFCGKDNAVSLLFLTEFPTPTQEEMRTYPTRFTFSDTGHRQRLPLNICQE